MKERPVLEKGLDSKLFRDFYYLKEELVDFCKKNDLPSSGGKIEISNRIAHFLDTGEVLSSSIIRKRAAAISDIQEHTTIETDFVCSENHRAFFKEQIGRSFSFNVAFQKWLKSNAGKTYKDAVAAYYQILEDKKKGKTTIDKQFEYNTYIRDFFADNQGKTLEEAIQCWKCKKQRQGHNRYEKSDLIGSDSYKSLQRCTMNIKKVTGAKKEYIDLLLLADEQENMVDQYLERGDMFVLEDQGVKAECVITKEGDGVYELKNIAVLPGYQRKGYGKRLIEFLTTYYSDCNTLFVGTGDCPSALSFYHSCGFQESHRVKNFFTDHYDHLMFEDGVQLVDMVYLKKER